MKKNYDELIKMIDIENDMYILLIFATLLNVDANKKLKSRYQNYQNLTKEIKEEYLFSTYIGLFVFIFFLKRNIKVLENLEINTKEYELSKLRIFGSYLFILGQLIVIYYLLNSNSDLDSPL